MTAINDEIVRQLRWLRRYARALTGSGKAGDSLALSAALTLRESPPRRRQWVRGALFRTLSAAIAPRADAAAPPAPLWIQARLLLYVERFSPRRAARILGVTSRRLRELMADSEAARRADDGRPVLILDTEPFISLQISSDLEEWGFRVVGMARSRSEASSLAQREPPDVIVLTSAIRFDDSHEPLRAAEEIARICGSSLVLTTGYPQRFLSGERGEWAFILEKPFHPDMFGAMVSQALHTCAVTAA